MDETSKPKAVWWRLQFKLRTLALWTVIAAVAFAGWRYWESTRVPRGIAAAIASADYLSAEEKKLFTAIAWQSNQQQLLKNLLLNKDWYESWTELGLMEAFAPHVRFSGTYRNSTGQARRVFVIAGEVPPVIVVTDDRYAVQQWLVPSPKASYSYATMRETTRHPILVVFVGDSDFQGAIMGHPFQLIDDKIVAIPTESN